ncbi:MAG: TonB-dependent receptor [Flavobacterium sp.]|nr:TonB-dependent receptor [Flavobacterium sp.]
MKSKFTWILTLCLAFFIQFSYAQEKTITGTVVSKTDQSPLPGVSILVQGTTKGVQTDFDGKFSISAAPGQKLVFTFLGTKTQTVTVGASNTVSIQLEDDTTALDVVVVQGYDVKRTKAKSNIASVTVSAATIEARPNASFIQTLQGQIAGLQISTGSGQPGSGSFVVIRGLGSINGKVEPLYVIDGVPLNADNFRSLNPDDIESTSVLKDAGATAIYGNKGANGVIIVKTKKGGFDSALKVKYSSVSGFSTMQKTKYNMMNAQQLLTLERNYGSGRGVGMTDAEIAATPSTNWNDYFFRTAVSQNHVLSMSQGSKNLSTFTSVGFLDQEGILKSTGLKRFNFRSNVTGKSNDGKFNYATSVTLNFSRNNLATSLGTGGVNQNYVLGANNSAPYISPSEYTTSAQLLADYQASGTLALTPLFLIDKLNTFSTATDELKGVLSFEASYKFAKNFTIGVNQGIDYTQTNGLTFQPPGAFNSLIFEGSNGYVGQTSESFSRDVAFNTNTRLNYNKTFGGKHTVDVTLFTEYYKAHAKSNGFTQYGLDPKVAYPGAGTGFISDTPANDFNVPDVTSGIAELGLFSYFAVADYDFDSKYGVGATIRRDASSRFSDTNRWGTFYSFTGRWNLDQENFMKGSAITMLKLRGSYGTNGNQEITGTTYGALSSTKDIYASGSSYQLLPAYAIGSLGNSDLKWETTTQKDIGVDFEVFDRRLTGSVDYYHKKTTDLYLSLPLSAITGQGSLAANFGELTNSGFETTLSYDLVRAKSTDGLDISLNFNASFNKNRIGDLPNEDGIVDDGGLTVISEGHRLNEFYAIRYVGVNPADGNLLFLDADGNPTENPDQINDRVYTGKSSQPSIQGGFGTDVSYKGFFINASFSFVADVYRLDYDLSGVQDPSDIGVFNKSTDILRAWTPDNRITDIPSLSVQNASLDANSDRYIKNADYLRLRYMSIGYNVPKKFLDKTLFSAVKAYVQAENLVTWSKWRGWDAESPRGSDQYQYPTPKILSVGLQLEF